MEIIVVGSEDKTAVDIEPGKVIRFKNGKYGLRIFDIDKESGHVGWGRVVMLEDSPGCADKMKLMKKDSLYDCKEPVEKVFQIKELVLEAE